MTTSAHYFLLLLLLGALALVGIVFAPYLSVFVLTIVLGVLFYPVHRRLRKKIPDWMSALITTLLVVIVILGPVSFVVSQIVREASNILNGLTIDSSSATNIVSIIEERIQAVVPSGDIEITQYIESGLQWIMNRSSAIFESAVGVGIALMLSVIGIFYWFLDSEKLGAIVIKASPLLDSDDRGILRTLSAFIHSVITGTLMVAIIQGVIAGIGFVIFGIPNPVLWASMVVVAALVPTIGTGLVLIPLILYLWISGNIPYAIGLTVWGGLAVGLIDNIVGPKLMGRGGKVHPFFILIAVLGGIQLFGPVGLFAGPLIVATFCALFEVYSEKTKTM